jgi:hypothetical protein
VSPLSGTDMVVDAVAHCISSVSVDRGRDSLQKGN